jgi:hypothetical protein
VRLKVNVIVTTGPPGIRAAKEATVMIPIVMAQDGDPVASGSLPALRDLAVISLGCQALRRR